MTIVPGLVRALSEEAEEEEEAGELLDELERLLGGNGNLMPINSNELLRDGRTLG